MPFGSLPFRQTKGEVLIIRVPGWPPAGLVHDRINIVPMGLDLYWVGSTFDWQDASLDTTSGGRKKLELQLKNILNCPFEIVDQQAGIRPTIKDRRPLLGRHPEHENLYIFNGMGTRGVMLAPFFAGQLARHIENGENLDREVDIARFSELA